MTTHYDLTDVRGLLFFAALLALTALALAVVKWRAVVKRRRLHDRLNGPNFRTIHSPYYRTYK